jgi:hypothetical protein
MIYFLIYCISYTYGAFNPGRTIHGGRIKCRRVKVNNNVEIKNAWNHTSTSQIRLHGVRNNFTFTDSLSHFTFFNIEP